MRLLIISLSWIILLSACSSKDKEKKTIIIPKDDMVNILEDIHMANGIFALGYVRKKYPGTDSLGNYRDIFSRYGYTMQDFQRSLDYYIGHLKEYDVIYDQVIKDFNTLQESLYNRDMLPEERRKMKREGNLWTLKTEWHLPREGQRNKIPFSVPVKGPGVYTLSMRIHVGRNDGSRHPYILVYFWNDDGTPGGHRIYWKKKHLTKGAEFKQYILSKALKDTNITYLKGYLLDDENKDTLYIKHADIRDIFLDVKPFHTGAAPDTISTKR